MPEFDPCINGQMLFIPNIHKLKLSQVIELEKEADSLSFEELFNPVSFEEFLKNYNPLECQLLRTIEEDK